MRLKEYLPHWIVAVIRVKHKVHRAGPSNTASGPPSVNYYSHLIIDHAAENDIKAMVISI